VRKVGVINTQN